MTAIVGRVSRTLPYPIFGLTTYTCFLLARVLPDFCLTPYTYMFVNMLQSVLNTYNHVNGEKRVSNLVTISTHLVGFTLLYLF